MRLLPRFSLRIALVCALCLVLVTPIRPSLLNPPANVQLPPDVFFGCAGCILLASLAPQTVTSSNGSFRATLLTAVMMDPNVVPGVRAGAGLDFFYQLTNAASSTDSIGRFTAINFNTLPNLMVDVGYNLGVGGLGGFQSFSIATPGFVDRVPPGDTIGWTYNAPLSIPLMPGTTSLIMEVKTNATNYAAGAAAALDGGTANFLTFQPAP